MWVFWKNTPSESLYMPFDWLKEPALESYVKGCTITALSVQLPLTLHGDVALVCIS